MRETPIAVVIVCRNALEALRKTLDSVRAQRDHRLLPIVIDGASTDGTTSYLESLGAWPLHWRSEPDRGIYDAMNKGWTAAPEDAYVFYLGAGDLLMRVPDAQALTDTNGVPYPLVLGQTEVGSMRFRSRWTRELYLRNTAHHQAMLLLKRVSPQPPFDAGLRTYADWDFNLRLFGQGVRAMHVPTLRTYAAPGGVSWDMDTAEIYRVAARHHGRLVGAASWALNCVSRWRRRRAAAHST